MAVKGYGSGTEVVLFAACPVFCSAKDLYLAHGELWMSLFSAVWDRDDGEIAPAVVRSVAASQPCGDGKGSTKSARFPGIRFRVANIPTETSPLESGPRRYVG
jgi:hypothetical protein